MLQRLRTYISSFFSLLLDRKEKEKKLEERLLETLNLLIQDHKDERDFFKSWITGFQTIGNQQVNTRSQDADIIEALEDEARLGNVLAQDIVASDEKMRDYIRTIREAN